jgi:hypothetical protein
MPEERTLLSGSLVGLSISECHDLTPRGFSKTHLRDTLIEFTRQLLSRDADIAYGGYLHAEGFTRQLFEVVGMHNASGAPATYRPTHNYLAWPLHLKVDEDREAELDAVASIYRVPMPTDLVADFGLDLQVYVEPDSTLHRYIWARCLTAMREQLNNAVHVRVLMGGKVKGYAGKYPGLLGEAYIALRAEKPLFLLGAFGGCTCAVSELLTGGRPESLTLEFQCQDENYQSFIEEYNKRTATRPALGLEPIDYEQVGEAFRSVGMAGLRNGLTFEENRQLFDAIDLDEIIHLVLKGLSNL